MRYILLSLFVVGCGSTSIPEGETSWSATLGAWETPTCKGSMRLVAAVAETTKLSGSWYCGTVYSGAASGEVMPDGRVFMDLETTPGYFNRVRGTLASDDAIAGDILIGGVVTPFAAYRQ